MSSRRSQHLFALIFYGLLSVVLAPTVGSGSTKPCLEAAEPAESPKPLGIGSDGRRLSVQVATIEVIW
ncbi:MAG: hypothetical protein M1319_01990 [Chloroflexi bacterium]|nr:hypothetical protein [Chloroflexota bacterium]